MNVKKNDTAKLLTFTKQDFLAWLDSQPQNRTFNLGSGTKCPFAEFIKEFFSASVYLGWGSSSEKEVTVSTWGDFVGSLPKWAGETCWNLSKDVFGLNRSNLSIKKIKEYIK